MLRDTEQPYPIDLNVDYGATKLTLKGTVQDPFQWTGANADLTLSGPNLSEIYPLLGIPGPPTPPYRISGKLEREPGLWKFVNTKWHVGDSDLTGDILIDETKKPEFLTAKLVSQHLVFADLAPLVGAPPGKTGNVSAQQKQTQQQLEATGDLFPNVPLHTERLQGDEHGRHARRQEGRRAGLSAGAGTGLPRPDQQRRGDGQAAHFVADRRRHHRGRARDRRPDRSPQGAGRAQGDEHRARHVLPQFALFRHHHGKIQGQVALAGSGKSLAQVMSVADGHVDVVLSGGSVSSLMVSLAGLQLFDALILYVTGDNRIPILCALGRLNFQHGTVMFDRTLLDTQKSILHVTGQVALQSQVVNVEVKADPKAFDLLDLHGPVFVAGQDPLAPDLDRPRHPDPDPGFRQRQERGLRGHRPAAIFQSITSLLHGRLLWRQEGRRRSAVTIV